MGSGGDVSCGDEDGLGLDYMVFGGERFRDAIDVGVS